MNESDWWNLPCDSLTTAVRWGVSFALLGILALLVDFQEVYRTLQSANLPLLGAALGVAFADRLLMAGKWFPLLRVQLPDAKISRAIRAYFASGFAGLILPSSVGGDALRSVGLGRDRDSVVEVSASVVLERLLGLVGSGIVTLLVLWVAWKASIQMGVLLPWALACFGVSLLLAIVPYSAHMRRGLGKVLRHFEGKRWANLLRRFGEACKTYRGHQRTLLVVGFLSVVEQFAPILVLWIGARALHLGLSFESIFVAVPLTFFVARLPVSVAGIGVVEGGLVYLLGLFGASVSQAVSLSVVGRVVELCTLLPGAVWWNELTGRGARDQKSPTAMAQSEE